MFVSLCSYRLERRSVLRQCHMKMNETTIGSGCCACTSKYVCYFSLFHFFSHLLVLSGHYFESIASALLSETSTNEKKQSHEVNAILYASHTRGDVCVCVL